MTDVFMVGFITLLACTAIFYIVFFSFVYYWHLKKITYVVVPVIFTFEFFAIGFLVLSIVSIIINYLPAVIRAIGL